jgi:uncharacterized protein (TIGR02569 family)
LTGPDLDPDILDAFECVGENKPLHGGEGRSVRVGPCVFKPIENPDRYKWSCELLLRVSQDGFRIPEPIRAKNGSFVFKGWSATTFEPGEHVQGRWDEKIEILRTFHLRLRELDHPPMPPSDDRWSWAHEIAWQNAPMPVSIHLDIVRLVEELFAHYQPLTRSEGIIHSDFGGNVLFHDKLNPCIIDFSPAYGCMEYAEAIMIADVIAWENAPLNLLDLLPFDEKYRQFLLRAINFRIIVAALFVPADVNYFLEEYTAFEPLIDKIRLCTESRLA